MRQTEQFLMTLGWQIDSMLCVRSTLDPQLIAMNHAQSTGRTQVHFVREMHLEDIMPIPQTHPWKAHNPIGPRSEKGSYREGKGRSRSAVANFRRRQERQS